MDASAECPACAAIRVPGCPLHDDEQEDPSPPPPPAKKRKRSPSPEREQGFNLARLKELAAASKETHTARLASLIQAHCERRLTEIPEPSLYIKWVDIRDPPPSPALRGATYEYLARQGAWIDIDGATDHADVFCISLTISGSGVHYHPEVL